MIEATLEGRKAFIRENTTLSAPPHTPELRLHLASEITPIWKLTEEALSEIGHGRGPGGRARVGTGTRLVGIGHGGAS